MSTQKRRMRPADRNTRGTKAKVPESSKRHWTMSLTVVNANERCRNNAAKICNPSKAVTIPSHGLEPLIKNLIPRCHFRWQREQALVTRVTSDQFAMADCCVIC